MTAPDVSTRCEKVLVLCADEECQGALLAWLRDAGFSVEVADGGSDANRRLDVGDVSALLIDRFPPPWRDLETIRTMKLRNPHLRVIVVGDPENEHFRLASAVGVDATLPRPLKRLNVLEALGMVP